eukprot:TRINITY_DN14470_c0_g1_i2.p2 TRINITY_DN14470_c0_g1~~TRINITY_DN14470_c0_g1_i2.p2  ORF type:complete len:218 (+),score=-51.53 TRINITY_DN14470_c0_g1_i2:191-844(+)
MIINSSGYVNIQTSQKHQITKNTKSQDYFYYYIILFYLQYSQLSHVTTNVRNVYAQHIYLYQRYLFKKYINRSYLDILTIYIPNIYKAYVYHFSISQIILSVVKKYICTYTYIYQQELFKYTNILVANIHKIFAMRYIYMSYTYTCVITSKYISILDMNVLYCCRLNYNSQIIYVYDIWRIKEIYFQYIQYNECMYYIMYCIEHIIQNNTKYLQLYN